MEEGGRYLGENVFKEINELEFPRSLALPILHDLAFSPSEFLRCQYRSDIELEFNTLFMNSIFSSKSLEYSPILPSFRAMQSNILHRQDDSIYNQNDFDSSTKIKSF